MMVSEAWLREVIGLFTILRWDCNRHVGGLAVYISDSRVGDGLALSPGFSAILMFFLIKNLCLSYNIFKRFYNRYGQLLFTDGGH